MGKIHQDYLDLSGANAPFGMGIPSERQFTQSAE
jgi:hypothetical protein